MIYGNSAFMKGNGIMKKVMEDLKLHIIENSKEAQDEFGHAYGSEWLQITIEQIEELKKGKQLAYSDGEYAYFISLTDPEKRED